MAGLITALGGSLAAALGLAALPVREREGQRIPALGVVRLADGNDGLSITAAGFDDTITTWLVDAEADGEVAVRLAQLLGLVRHFPADAEIAIAADDSAATVSSGRSNFKLPVFPIAKLLPPLILGEETGYAALDGKIARDLFARPVFAAADEASHPHLRGIFLHNAGDKLAAVATDGFRLCRITTPVTTMLSQDRRLIIPSEIVKCICRLLSDASGNVTLRRSERLFSIEGAGFSVVSSRIDQTYPDYERCLPSEGPSVVIASRAVLSKSLARFAAVVDPQTRNDVSLRWDADGLQLSTPDGSEDCFAADVQGEGETWVQIRYLVELIGALRGDDVRMSVAGPGSMICFTDPQDESFFAGQMPIRPRSS